MTRKHNEVINVYLQNGDIVEFDVNPEFIIQITCMDNKGNIAVTPLKIDMNGFSIAKKSDPLDSCGNSNNCDSSSKLQKVKEIFDKYGFYSGEQIAQTDRFYEDSVEFVCEIAEIVGWGKCPYDDEDEDE